MDTAPRAQPAAQPHQLVLRTVALVLAGGRGSRLKQLTDKRAKPAVYFGGKFRIIDFALSQLRQLGHAPHRRGHPVQEPLAAASPAARLELPAIRDERDGRPAARAAARRRGALVPRHRPTPIYQNLDIIQSSRPEYIVVLAGDHIYKMDYSLMLKDHVESGAGCTVGCIEVPRAEASAFGVMADQQPAQDHQLRREARRPAADARPPRMSGAGQHGHLRLRRRLPVSSLLEAGPGQPAVQPRLRQGRDPARRGRRQARWRIRSR